MKYILFFIMIFFHIVDDFYLQTLGTGVLAKFKQKSWWKENCPDELYANDYKIALLIHGFSWSFMISLPALVYRTVIGCNDQFYVFYAVLLILNTIIHAAIDDGKANKLRLSLISDQVLHIMQITYTYLALAHLFW